jgi:hypothetical protein
MIGYESVNLIAVLAAGLVAFVLGSLWYSPLLFGGIWKKLSKVKKHKKDKFLWLRYLIYFIGMFLMAFVLGHFLIFAAAVTYIEALVTAFWLWLGFIAPITIGGVLWEYKSVKLFLLNNAYNLIALGLMSTILIAMS